MLVSPKFWHPSPLSKRSTTSPLNHLPHPSTPLRLDLPKHPFCVDLLRLSAFIPYTRGSSSMPEDSSPLLLGALILLWLQEIPGGERNPRAGRRWLMRNKRGRPHLTGRHHLSSGGRSCFLRRGASMESDGGTRDTNYCLLPSFFPPTIREITTWLPHPTLLTGSVYVGPSFPLDQVLKPTTN